MPFNANGAWEEPTEEDLQELKELIENPEDKVTKYSQIPSELIEELNAQRRRVAYQKNSLKKNLNALETMMKGNLKPVDIILPVYGALPLVKQCISSVLQRTWYPYNLIIIDDASPDNTVQGYLDKIKHPRLKVLFNKRNKGFAGTVNRGILNGEGHYICILNSDVIVTDGWLTKMVMALESDPRNQIVNPCTNNTALISIPMAPGMNYKDMNHVLETVSERRYPEIMPTGFCFMFRKELTDIVGMLDEGYGSYGEESDYWFKTLQATKDGEYKGYRAVLADDTYLFHERGSSFSQLGDDEHMGIRKKGNDRFHQLNPGFSEWSNTFDIEAAIGAIKNNLPPQALSDVEYKYNIAWVVNSTNYCGGMKYITDVVNQLIEEGVNAKVVCVPQHPNQIQNTLPQLHTEPIMFESEEDFINNFNREVFSNGIVVAAVGQVVELVHKLTTRHPAHFRSLHHIQSYDPILAKFIDSKREEEMKATIGVLDKTICSSKWVKNFGHTLVPKDAICIPPGVEFDTFHPRDRTKGDERPTVLIYMSKDYPFRGYDRGIIVCKELWQKARSENKEIRILAVGSLSVPECPYVIGLGKLNPNRLAHILGTEVDVFIDPAYVHSYGLPCLEALVSGSRVVTWMNGGVSDYANSFKNQITVLPEGAKPIDIASSAFEQLNKKRIHTFKLPVEHMRNESVSSFVREVDTLFNMNKDTKKIIVVTPHLRKHGGPSTIVNLANILAHQGDDVSLLTIYKDFNKELINAANVPIKVDWQNNERKADLVIVNSDNPYSDYFANHPGFKHKVLLKLSHNARFKELEEKSLNQEWDKIITSSEWLREACIVKKEGWTHKEWPKEKVKRIGWYHYSHHIFDCGGINNRTYGSLNHSNLRIGILVHQHPLKGSNEGMKILMELYNKYGNNIQFFGVGEVKSKVPGWFQYFKSLNRTEMSRVMRQADVWINCSHTEGLGRMMLEAMSAGAAIICTDTGAEFIKSGENALTFPVGDVDAGLAQTEKLINDVNLMAKIIKNGYATSIKYSPPWEYAENIHKVIKEVIDD